ncbi:MAG: sulfite exporter TauE/SafE family protein [Pseudanabaena sp. ELA607]
MTQHIWHTLLIFGASLLAGALNGVAGGGSFILFPALIFVGIPPIPANATNTFALLPGTLASAGAYHQEFNESRRELLQLCSIGIVGGLLGAILLLKTPPKTFMVVLPYLLLFATALFAFSPQLTRWLTAQQERFGQLQKFTRWLIPVIQMVISMYGGFFGGGMGILFLATFALMGIGTIHRMNAFKTFLTSCINAVAVIPFAISGVIWWREAIITAIGAALGGFLSAHYAQKIAPLLVRRFVIVVGTMLTVYFFVISR